MSGFLYHFLSYPYYLIYAGIFLLMIFLGEEFLLIIGALARFGIVDFWDAVFFALLGTFLGDILWYQLGRRYGEDFVSIGWVMAFISLGYFFAHNLAALQHDVKVFAILMVLVFGGFILLEKFIEKLIESKVIGRENGNSNDLSPRP